MTLIFSLKNKIYCNSAKHLIPAIKIPTIKDKGKWKGEWKRSRTQMHSQVPWPIASHGARLKLKWDWSWSWLAGAAFISRCSDNKIIHACKSTSLEFIATSGASHWLQQRAPLSPVRMRNMSSKFSGKNFRGTNGQPPCRRVLLETLARFSQMQSRIYAKRGVWVPQELSGHENHNNLEQFNRPLVRVALHASSADGHVITCGLLYILLVLIKV